VILISAKQGGGKTTLSEKLIERLSARPQTIAVVMKFADPIYRMHDYCLQILKSLNVETPRKHGPLLQLLGTEFGRKTISENVWVHAAQGAVKQFTESSLASNYNPNRIAIFDDCRFKNELEGFPDALKVRLECPRDIRKARCVGWRDNEHHASEIDLDDWVYSGKFDMIMETSITTPDECAERVVSALESGSWRK
jgi:hypothetical protein